MSAENKIIGEYNHMATYDSIAISMQRKLEGKMSIITTDILLTLCSKP